MTIAGLRRSIDALDDALLALLNRRARVVARVAELKRAQRRPIYDPKRERELRSRLLAANRGPLGAAAVDRIFAGLVHEFRRFEGEAPAEPREGGLTVAIVGLGLIGGSLAWALRERTGHRILGIVPRGRRPSAQERRWVDEVADDPARACSADIVVLAAPLEESLRLLRRLASRARAGTLWTDVGSVKSPFCASAARLLPLGVSVIGGHPMAGSAKGGAANARADLFSGAAWALCPVRGGDRWLPRLQKLVRAAGAEPFLIGPGEHDRLAAFTSHLPQIAASALAAAVLPALGPAGRRLAGPGLRDTTRLADSDAALWREIAGLNRANLRRALNAYRRIMERTSALTPSRIEELFRRAHEARRSLFPR